MPTHPGRVTGQRWRVRRQLGDHQLLRRCQKSSEVAASPFSNLVVDGYPGGIQPGPAEHRRPACEVVEDEVVDEHPADAEGTIEVAGGGETQSGCVGG